MHKSERLQAIAEIVSSQPVTRQEQLSNLLVQRGYKVTQASISRDLDELGITKVNGRYSLPSRPLGSVSSAVLTLLIAGDNLIVAKCPPGLASAAAVRIDALDLPEVVGTIAGDDTIFIAVKNPADQKAALKKIMEIY